MKRPFLVLPFLIITIGCANSERSDRTAPMHTHIVSSSEEGGDFSERNRAFNEWAEKAIHFPTSSFTIWTVDQATSKYRHYFTACIPQTWGAGVLQAKAAFLRTARERVSSLPKLVSSESFLPASCRLPSHEDEEHSPLLIDKSLLPSEGLREISESAGTELSFHVAIVCDNSEKSYNFCNPDALLNNYDMWLSKTRWIVGSTFNIYATGRSRESTLFILKTTIPPLSLGERAAFLIAERAKLKKTAIPSIPYSSAIIEGVHFAVSELQQRPGRYSLVVLSDLREYSPPLWNFERKIPSIKVFSEWLKKADLMMDLTTTSISACGVHKSVSSQPSSQKPNSSHIQKVWHDIFFGMGATVHFYLNCDEAAFDRSIPQS